MTPLKYIKYIVDRLDGTAFEPLVNGLLFLLFSVAVIMAIRLLIGHKLIDKAVSSVKNATKRFNRSLQYAPEIEEIAQHKIASYIDIFCFLSMALVGLYSAIVVFIIYILSSKENVMWYGHLAMFAMIIASLIFMRFCLAKASWSYHQTRKKS